MVTKHTVNDVQIHFNKQFRKQIKEKKIEATGESKSTCPLLFAHEKLLSLLVLIFPSLCTFCLFQFHQVDEKSTFKWQSNELIKSVNLYCTEADLINTVYFQWCGKKSRNEYSCRVWHASP